MKSTETAVNDINFSDNDNILALAESELIAKEPNRKHYSSFADILKESDEEQDNE